jgi:UDP-2,3-diacylglucosamine hydrolase
VVIDKSQGRKKIYFASDFHLGIPDYESSLKRERMLVEWLDRSMADALEIYLMGDIFDFWFEYKTVVPKGYVRLLGKIAEITEHGIPVHIFTGNHDIWAFGYLEKELNVRLHRHPEIKEMLGRQFYLAHGDGLGPGDNGYKMLKKVFSNRFNQWLFRWLHPDIGARMALYFSRQSRLAHNVRENRPDFVNSIENEMLYKYAVQLVNEGMQVDFFLFGHRHRPIDLKINDNTRLIILGDWLTNFTYAEFDGQNIELKHFQK